MKKIFLSLTFVLVSNISFNLQAQTFTSKELIGQTETLELKTSPKTAINGSVNDSYTSENGSSTITTKSCTIIGEIDAIGNSVILYQRGPNNERIPVKVNIVDGKIDLSNLPPGEYFSEGYSTNTVVPCSVTVTNSQGRIIYYNPSNIIPVDQLPSSPFTIHRSDDKPEPCPLSDDIIEQYPIPKIPDYPNEPQPCPPIPKMLDGSSKFGL